MRYFLFLILLLSLSYSNENEVDSTKNIWQNRLDPVYLLDVKKYPRFSTEMVLKNGKKIEFVSVKSMMNFYFHPEKYPEYRVKSREEISQMFVKDYLSGEKIDAKDAWYIFGSRLIGPHGDDLIPLSSQTKVELFMKKYGGSRVLKIDKFTFGLIKYLDM
jgi:nitrous oxide reductase accessory protein NosL